MSLLLLLLVAAVVFVTHMARQWQIRRDLNGNKSIEPLHTSTKQTRTQHSSSSSSSSSNRSSCSSSSSSSSGRSSTSTSTGTSSSSSEAEAEVLQPVATAAAEAVAEVVFLSPTEVVVVVVVVVEHFTVAPIKTTIVISTLMLYCYVYWFVFITFCCWQVSTDITGVLIVAGICSLLLFLFLPKVPVVVIVAIPILL